MRAAASCGAHSVNNSDFAYGHHTIMKTFKTCLPGLLLGLSLCGISPCFAQNGVVVNWVSQDIDILPVKAGYPIQGQAKTVVNATNYETRYSADCQFDSSFYDQTGGNYLGSNRSAYFIPANTTTPLPASHSYPINMGTGQIRQIAGNCYVSGPYGQTFLNHPKTFNY